MIQGLPRGVQGLFRDRGQWQFVNSFRTKRTKAELVTLDADDRRPVDGMDPVHDRRERGAMAYVTSIHAERRSRALPASLGHRVRATISLDERQY